MKVGLGGAAGGLVLGLALAFWVNFRNGAFQSERELSAQLALPLVIGVPLMLTPNEQRGRARRVIYEWIAGTALTMAVIAAECYELFWNHSA